MSETTLEYKFSYENNKSFKLQRKLNAEDYELLIELDENTHIADVWGYVEGLCKKNFEIDVNSIGDAMKG